MQLQLFKDVDLFFRGRPPVSGGVLSENFIEWPWYVRIIFNETSKDVACPEEAFEQLCSTWEQKITDGTRVLHLLQNDKECRADEVSKKHDFRAEEEAILQLLFDAGFPRESQNVLNVIEVRLWIMGVGNNIAKVHTRIISVYLKYVIVFFQDPELRHIHGWWALPSSAERWQGNQGG